MLIAYVFVFMVAVLYGGSLAFAEVTGFNRSAVLWVTVVLVGAYTVRGGLASVVWTDAAQCIMLLGGGIVLFFIALNHLPGGPLEAWESMRQAHPERFHLYNPPSDPIAPFPGLIVSTFGLALFYQATNQVMIQRVLAARSTWDGIMGIIFAGGINFLRPLATCFLGFIVFHWIDVMHMAPPLEDKDQAFPFALQVFSPEWGLRGIVLAGFLAAVMSTISSLVNSIATIFAFDVYGKLRAGASERRLVSVGQLASIAALLVAALASPIVGYLGGIFLYFQQAVTYLATPFASVVLIGVLWKRANYAGGLFGIAGGLGIQLTTVVIAEMAGIELNWLYLAFIAQVLTMAGIIVVSLATAAPSEAQWSPFLWRPRLVRETDAGEPRPWYSRIWLWFSLYAFVWCAIYWYLW
jgi:SSS family solute:Na+ symporter